MKIENQIYIFRYNKSDKMSRKLKDYIELLQSVNDKRDDLEMGTFVTWLRRRNPILRNLETSRFLFTQLLYFCYLVTVNKLHAKKPENK